MLGFLFLHLKSIEATLLKNKYLRLAYYLNKNRNDWSDGHSYAESGLSGFAVEKQIDSDIYNDISSYIDDGWDGDGRVFRDCKYNYTVLYGMVEDKSLVDLIQRLMVYED